MAHLNPDYEFPDCPNCVHRGWVVGLSSIPLLIGGGMVAYYSTREKITEDFTIKFLKNMGLPTALFALACCILTTFLLSTNCEEAEGNCLECISWRSYAGPNGVLMWTGIAGMLCTLPLFYGGSPKHNFSPLVFGICCFCCALLEGFILPNVPAMKCIGEEDDDVYNIGGWDEPPSEPPAEPLAEPPAPVDRSNLTDCHWPDPIDNDIKCAYITQRQCLDLGGTQPIDGKCDKTYGRISLIKMLTRGASAGLAASEVVRESER